MDVYPIIFKTLHIDGFLSFGKTSLQTDVPGLAVVQGINKDCGGSNGAGKTGLFEALYWCLYGNLLRKGTKGQVVNSKKSKCQVKIELDVNNIPVTVTRSISSGGKTSLGVTVAGKNETAVTIALTQQYISTFIMPPDIFRYTVLFGKGGRFNESVDADKKSLILDMLGLYFEDAYKSAKELRKSAEHAFSVVEAELAGLESNISQLEEFIRGQRGQAERWVREQAEIEAQRAQELEKARRELEVCLVQLDELTAMKDRASHSFEEASQATKAMRDNWQVESRQIAVLESRQKEVLKIIRELQQSLLNDPPTCSLCKRPLRDAMSKDAAGEIESRIDEKQQILREIVSQKNSLNSELAGKAQELRASENAERQAKEAFNSMNSKISGLVSRKYWLESRMSQLGAEGSAKVTPPDMYLEEREEKLKKQTARIQELKAKKDEQEKLVKEYSGWEAAFHKDGCPAMALQELLGELRVRAAEYAKQLSDDRLELSVEVVKDALTVSAQLDGAPSYNLLSQGWQSRVDLALFMACHDLANRSNLLVIDEALDVIDLTGVSHLLTILKKRCAAGGSVVVITHRDDVRQLIRVDGVREIRVVKEGISRVEVSTEV